MKVNGTSAVGDSSIDRAGVIYLIRARKRDCLGFMPPQTNPDRLTEVLRHHLAE